MLQVFKESRIVEYTVEENELSPGKHEVSLHVFLTWDYCSFPLSVLIILLTFPLFLLLQITVDNKQYYKFLGKDVDMISLIKLYVENGKVIRHEDWYTLKRFSSIICTYASIPCILQYSLGDGFCFAWDVFCRWDKKPPRSRETEKIPMFGIVMEAMRRGAMLATHAMMGFGKDPQ